MGRLKNGRVSEEVETAIDMSPLIDCVFILLIFFIVTTVFVEETGVEVDKPQAASASNLESNSILIAITADGDVIYAKKNIGVQGVSPLVKRLTLADPEMPVIIQADKGADVGTYSRVLDEASRAGAKKVSLSTNKSSS